MLNYTLLLEIDQARDEKSLSIHLRAKSTSKDMSPTHLILIPVTGSSAFIKTGPNGPSHRDSDIHEQQLQRTF